MKRLSFLPKIINISLALWLLTGCGTLVVRTTSLSTPVPTHPAGPTGTTPTPTPVLIPTLPAGPAGTPVPGQWTATAKGLGTFTFTVNPQSTAITEIVLHIPSMSCGGVSLDGSSADVQNSWPVSNGLFTLDPLPNPILDLTLIGKFDTMGKHVVGIWKMTANNTTCPGTWTGGSIG